MDIKEININKLIENNINIKENCFAANKKLKESLNKYGQLYPILIKKNTFEIIKGSNIIKAMKELNWSKVLIQEIDINTDIDLLKFKYLLHQTQNDVNVLKLSLIVKELNKSFNINEISEKLGININQLINYIDLLKLENLIKAKTEKNQPKLF